MDRSQFIEQMAENHSLGKGASSFMVELFLKEAARALIKEGKLELEAFGTFIVTDLESCASDRKTITEKRVTFNAGPMLDPVRDHAADALTTEQVNLLLDGL